MTGTKRNNSSTFLGEQTREGPSEEQGSSINYSCTADFENAGDKIFLRANYFMGHFEGYFEGAKTFLTL